MEKLLIGMLLFTVLLVGCKTGWINPSKMSKVSVGMTKPEVIKILGTPHDVDGRQGSETLWYLEDQGSWIHVYHFVELKDGKVESYGLGKEGGEKNKLMQPNVPRSAPAVVPIIVR